MANRSSEPEMTVAQRIDAYYDAERARQQQTDFQAKYHDGKRSAFNPMIKPSSREWRNQRNFFLEDLNRPESTVRSVMRDHLLPVHELYLMPSIVQSVAAIQDVHTSLYKRSLKPGGQFSGEPDNLPTKMTMLYFGLPIEPITLNNINACDGDQPSRDHDDEDDPEDPPPRIQRIIYAEKPLEFLDRYNERSHGSPILRRVAPPKYHIPDPYTAHLNLRGGAGSPHELETRNNHTEDVDYRKTYATAAKLNAPILDGLSNVSLRGGGGGVGSIMSWMSGRYNEAELRTAEETDKAKNRWLYSHVQKIPVSFDGGAEEFLERAAILLNFAPNRVWAFHIDIYNNRGVINKQRRVKDYQRTLDIDDTNFHREYKQSIEPPLYNYEEDWVVLVSKPREEGAEAQRKFRPASVQELDHRRVPVEQVPPTASAASIKPASPAETASLLKAPQATRVSLPAESGPLSPFAKPPTPATSPLKPAQKSPAKVSFAPGSSEAPLDLSDTPEDTSPEPEPIVKSPGKSSLKTAAYSSPVAQPKTVTTSIIAPASVEKIIPEHNPPRLMANPAEKASPQSWPAYSAEQSRKDTKQRESFTKDHSVVEEGHKPEHLPYGSTKERGIKGGDSTPMVLTHDITPTASQQSQDEIRALRNHVLERKDLCGTCHQDFAKYEPDRVEAHYEAHRQRERDSQQCPLCGDGRWPTLNMAQRRKHLEIDYERAGTIDKTNYWKGQRCPACDLSFEGMKREDIAEHLINEHYPGVISFCSKCGIDKSKLNEAEKVHHKICCVDEPDREKDHSEDEYCERCGKQLVGIGDAGDKLHQQSCHAGQQWFHTGCGIEFTGWDPTDQQRHKEFCKPPGGWRGKFCQRCARNLYELEGDSEEKTSARKQHSETCHRRVEPVHTPAEEQIAMLNKRIEEVKGQEAKLVALQALVNSQATLEARTMIDQVTQFSEEHHGAEDGDNDSTSRANHNHTVLSQGRTFGTIPKSSGKLNKCSFSCCDEDIGESTADELKAHFAKHAHDCEIIRCPLRKEDKPEEICGRHMRKTDPTDIAEHYRHHGSGGTHADETEREWWELLEEETRKANATLGASRAKEYVCTPGNPGSSYGYGSGSCGTRTAISAAPATSVHGEGEHVRIPEGVTIPLAASHNNNDPYGIYEASPQPPQRRRCGADSTVVEQNNTEHAASSHKDASLETLTPNQVKARKKKLNALEAELRKMKTDRKGKASETELGDIKKDIQELRHLLVGTPAAGEAAHGELIVDGTLPPSSKVSKGSKSSPPKAVTLTTSPGVTNQDPPATRSVTSSVKSLLKAPPKTPPHQTKGDDDAGLFRSGPRVGLGEIPNLPPSPNAARKPATWKRVAIEEPVSSLKRPDKRQKKKHVRIQDEEDGKEEEVAVQSESKRATRASGVPTVTPLASPRRGRPRKVPVKEEVVVVKKKSGGRK